MLSLKSEKEINMKVMVVGGGGREHAIIKKIKKAQRLQKSLHFRETAELRLMQPAWILERKTLKTS